MRTHSYFSIPGGHPPQTDLLTGRAVFTQAYAVIPRGVMQDIVTSNLPFWDRTRAWIIARPMSGFSETFSHYVMEVGAGGGSDTPEPDARAQGVLFVVDGQVERAVGAHVARRIAQVLAHHGVPVRVAPRTVAELAHDLELAGDPVRLSVDQRAVHVPQHGGEGEVDRGGRAQRGPPSTFSVVPVV